VKALGCIERRCVFEWGIGSTVNNFPEARSVQIEVNFYFPYRVDFVYEVEIFVNVFKVAICRHFDHRVHEGNVIGGRI